MKSRPDQVRNTKCGGNTLAEFAPALGLLISLGFIFCYILIAVFQAVTIQLALEQAATAAARGIALAYGNDPTIYRKSLDPVFSAITCMNVVVSPEQFEVSDWNLKAHPPTVTVQVVYQGGKNKLPPFPNPDIFNVNRRFIFQAHSTARLE